MLEHWARCLSEYWGINAALTALHGEYDLNFKAAEANGQRYLVKVMRPGCDADFVNMQCLALHHIHQSSVDVNVPEVVLSSDQRDYVCFADENEDERIVWVLSYVEGLVYADFSPKCAQLIENLGHSMAQMHKSLEGFDHTLLHRSFKWNLLEASWITDHFSVIADPHRQQILKEIMLSHHDLLARLSSLPSVAIHNDINDHNLFAARNLKGKPVISGIVDFGDMCSAPRVCDIAIAGAYIMMNHPNPELALCSLVKSFHNVIPLQDREVDLIYPLVRARLAVSVVNSTIEANEKPDDPYVVVSQGPAWELLENPVINPLLLSARLRVACGMPVNDSAANVSEYLTQQVRGNCEQVIGQSLDNAPCYSMSVEHCAVPQNPFNLTSDEASAIGSELIIKDDVWLGFYNEPRLIYTDEVFRTSASLHSNRRTIHLGIDIFAKQSCEIRAPLDGVVCAVENRTASLDYGGMVVLQHATPEGDNFYSLYGHLDPHSCESLKPGQSVEAGSVFAKLGAAEHNGGWQPHLHLQLAMSIEGLGLHWPGVADPDDRAFWTALCPNPAALLNLPDERTCFEPVCESELLEQRHENFSANLKLSYSNPVALMRGWQHYLFDQWGRPYLDAYNNVPHVGHAHPRLQSVVCKQLRQLNTNTRYLHPVQSKLARKLKSKLPEELCVCYFVNSGSEANELALRLSRAYTKGRDIITPDHGYHGNTTGAIDISAYKFNAPGGVGKPDWVSLVDIPDVYGGRYRQPDDDCASCYADQIDEALKAIRSRGGALAGFIAETYPSVGGQVIPPDGYLEKVYGKIRTAGGLCIADEVQTGLGRLGEFYFAFEQQEVIPDIVVLGKPIGNGHPVGAVITTKAISESFAQGPEFFSTFGGSTLSCVVAHEVLEIVDDEGLQANARKVGAFALEELAKLKQKHPVIGDVRGIGLFIGVVFVSDQTTRTPSGDIADYVVNRLRENRILAGTEGPENNVLKIRPPLTIDAQSVRHLVVTLDSILNESAVTQHAVAR